MARDTPGPGRPTTRCSRPGRASTASRARLLSPDGPDGPNDLAEVAAHRSPADEREELLEFAEQLGWHVGPPE